jgi:hypothetical protein
MDSLGFSVERQIFTTSARRLYAGSLLGAGLGWVALGLFPLLMLPVDLWIVFTIGLAALIAVVVVSVGIGAGVLPFEAEPVQATNLIGTRSSGPLLWLVAHSDTKAQWLSLRGRVIATVLTGAGSMLLVAALVVRIAGPLPWWVAALLLIPLLIGSAGLSRPPLHGESPGAVDNGSGVIAALSAAARLSDRQDIGVLITGAEEFGMEGARAWVQAAGSQGAGFVNFDGIDSVGRFNIMTHRSSPRTDENEERAKFLHRELRSVLRAGGHTVRDRPLPFGIFVDGSILARGGLWGVTVSRGTWETLSVIHTPRDTIERTDVGGAVVAGTATAEAVRRFFC